MSFRVDTPVAKCRKPRRCVWCDQMIDVGMPAVVVSGVGDDGFWAGKFHPECWRAEHTWWERSHCEDGWPCEAMNRGEDVYLQLWKSDPVSKEEAKHVIPFREAMKLTNVQNQDAQPIHDP